MEKKRLDLVMEERGLAHSRSLAQRLIMEGVVRVNGQVVLKAAQKIDAQDRVELAEPPRFVSRGGEKLLAALEAFDLTGLAGRTCADVGASTGGFTDCLLQHGAEKVFAIDVGYGVLDWKLRNDARVVVMERTNARYVNGLPEEISLVTIDASFISLSTLLPVIKTWFCNGTGEVVALIKPQFEAGRAETARGSGVIRDILVHRAVLLRVLAFAQEGGFQVCNLIKSPLTGPKGNIEFLVHLRLPQAEQCDPIAMVERVLGSPQPIPDSEAEKEGQGF